MMPENISVNDLLNITAEIVTAHVSNNPVSVSDLGGLITEVHRTLSSLASPVEAAASPEAVAPAVSVKKSVTADYLICLEDGKKLKMLKRYLMRSYGLTPDAYRAKWGLPKDYPMVAPSYAARRSAIATESGLGRGIKAS